jgi:Domain of unknown function (DUF4160)
MMQQRRVAQAARWLPVTEPEAATRSIGHRRPANALRLGSLEESLPTGESWGIGYPVRVSPTVLRVRGFRFYFFSREEPRAHVPVQHTDGEAKFWIEPTVGLHANYGLKPKQIVEAEGLVEEHLNEIRAAWAKHFSG